MSLLRLDTFLADMQIGTRSQVKQLIRKGRITVDGQICRQPETKIDTDRSEVTFDKQVISYVHLEYYLFHKPAGCVSATTDRNLPTVMDSIDAQRKDLFPVGRLDIDTEGLLLITNDGELAHQLLSPSHHVPKTYYAEIDGIVTDEDVLKFKEGLDIGEKNPTKPAELVILKSNVISQIEVTVYEGKFHQVKRMFEAVGKPVLYLKRIAFGPLTLPDDLKKGEYRSLTEDELEALKNR